METIEANRRTIDPDGQGAAPGGFMGQFMREQNSGLVEEAESAVATARALREQLDALRKSTAVLDLDPSVVRASAYANRHALAYVDKDFDDLKASIQIAGGNESPIAVRPAPDADGRYEIIYGHRRHAACLALRLPVKSLVLNVDDRQLVEMMERENDTRTRPSAYERGIHYRRLLDSKLYSSAREIAAVFGVARTQVNRLLRYREIPEPVVNVFRDPREIRVTWIEPLAMRAQTDLEAMLAEVKRLTASLEPLSSLATFNALMREPTGHDLLLAVGSKPLVKVNTKNGRTVFALAKNAPIDMIDEMVAVSRKWRDKLAGDS